MAQDHYATLGVKRNASADEIRKAYRELARKYHPDLHPDDNAAKQKFQEVQSAFDVLNDDKKRQMYDRYGDAFEHVDGGGQGPRASTWSGAGPGGQSVHFDFEDLFGGAAGAGGAGAGGGFADFFRQFRQQAPEASQPPRGGDLEHELTIPFATAVNGGQAQITVRRGDGKIDNITVKIPPGIEDGKRIRLRGQGDSAGGARGDILINVRVSPHPFFRRTGNRLDVTVPVTLAEALAGAKVDIPTPNGTISLTIPPGTSSGKRLRIKGQGIARKGATPGDLFAEIQIVLPADLAAADREALAKIAGKYGDSPRSELRW